MKKHFIVLSAVLFALVACNKETPIVEDGPIDASKLVFNVTVNHPGDTKAVKSNWVAGDKIYLFFENNTTAYVTLTSDDGSNRNWTPAISGELDLEHEGEHVTAVYLPFNTDTPTYDGGWKFETKYAYYLKAEGVEYTVTTDPSTDINTLDVKLSMVAPVGFVQFFLPDVSPVANKYVLIEEHIIPAGCGKITPGGSVEQVTRLRSSKMAVLKAESEVSYKTGTTAKEASNFDLVDVSTSGYPMTAMPVDEEGYYFYGTLSADVNNPTFYLVQQNPDYLFAIGTQTKTYTGKTLSAGAAIKFGAFGAQERWVDLNLPNGVKWATGNVSDAGMVAPDEYGSYYAWGEIVEREHTSEGVFTLNNNWQNYGFFKSGNTLYNADGNPPTSEVEAGHTYGDFNIFRNDVLVSKYIKGSYFRPTWKGTDAGGTGWYGARDPDPSQYTYDGKYRLESADDAATVNLGEHWRMGTQKEYRELVANCGSVSKNTQFNLNPNGTDAWINVNGINGWRLQRNGLYIFFPAAGTVTTWGNTIVQNNVYCYYWTSDLYANGNHNILMAHVLNWKSGNTNRLLQVVGGSYRRAPNSVRAVYVP